MIDLFRGVAALFAGLVLGIGLAFLREYLDDTIKSKDDLDAASGGITVLSVIPRVDDWKDRDRPQLVSIEAPKSPAAKGTPADSSRFSSPPMSKPPPSRPRQWKNPPPVG